MYALDQQTWNNVETKTGFDETIRKKINQIDTEGDGVVEKALADDQGNIISETYVSKLEAPKWKVYKALLTQSGENAPVARVLNQDEPDYLGDIEWTYEGGIAAGANVNLKERLSLVNPLLDTNGGFSIPSIYDGGIELPSNFDEQEIEIKVRQRGAPPKLLSAETNETGDKVILTFDKKMSEFNLYDEIIGAGSLSTGNHTISGYIYNNNIIILELSEPFVYLEEDGVINLSTRIESFDYGLLQQFENFPVVNNVVSNPV